MNCRKRCLSVLDVVQRKLKNKYLTFHRELIPVGAVQAVGALAECNIYGRQFVALFLSENLCFVYHAIFFVVFECISITLCKCPGNLKTEFISESVAFTAPRRLFYIQ